MKRNGVGKRRKEKGREREREAKEGKLNSMKCAGKI